MKKKYKQILFIPGLIVSLLLSSCWVGMSSTLLEWDYSSVENEELRNIKIIMDDPDSPNMIKLKTQYKLKEVVAGSDNDYEKLQKIVKWVHERWQHSGSNVPSKFDPITILEEAAQGKKFRCVEYGIVVAACARALGMKSRVLGLKRKDVETMKSGAGHVAAEVWLEEFNKWVFVDAQFDAIPELNGIPLNAVEFQNAIVHNTKGLLIRSSSLYGVKQSIYKKWLIPYLYYFDFNIDQRFFIETEQKVKTQIMLVPLGAKNPEVFQRKYPIKNCIYINNPEIFYSIK